MPIMSVMEPSPIVTLLGHSGPLKAQQGAGCGAIAQKLSHYSPLVP